MANILFIVLIITTVLILGLTVFIQKYLQKKHPATWQEIGSPLLILNNSVQNTSLFKKFVKQQMSGKVDDPFLTKLCKFYYFYKMLYLILFWILVILIVSKR